MAPGQQCTVAQVLAARRKRLAAALVRRVDRARRSAARRQPELARGAGVVPLGRTAPADRARMGSGRTRGRGAAGRCTDPIRARVGVDRLGVRAVPRVCAASLSRVFVALVRFAPGAAEVPRYWPQFALER